MRTENEWRLTHCPFDFPAANCPCDPEPCDGAWNCDALFFVTEDILWALDTNNDDVLGANDHIDSTHLSII